MASHKVARFIFFCLFALQCLSCAKLKCPPTPKESILPVVIPLISTLAGSGKNGYVDAADTQAYFGKPCGVAVDNEGNVYVGDRDNNVVRKISPAGAVTTFAGSGQLGAVNAIGTAASFYGPCGVAVDSIGNVYVADRANQLIRKITADGEVTTFAGSGNKGWNDGQAAVATFSYPSDVALDDSGNVFVADYFNNSIRKISPAGVVSTLAGGDSLLFGFTDATGSSARFLKPNGLAMDAAGNIIVADRGNNAIRKVTKAGVVSTIAGAGGKAGAINGSVDFATFNNPCDVVEDALGNIYVSDIYNNVIRKITPSGMVSNFAGTGLAGFSNGPADSATFNWPVAIAIDAQGNFYIADYNNYSIRKIVSP